MLFGLEWNTEGQRSNFMDLIAQMAATEDPKSSDAKRIANQFQEKAGISWGRALRNWRERFTPMASWWQRPPARHGPTEPHPGGDLQHFMSPWIMSEEGIQARINRGVAEAVRNVFQPMQEVSSQRRQESAYLDFLESHPEMKDPSFKREVAKMVGDRKSVGAPISTQDAYEIVRARKVVNEQRKRAETERRARADAARRVQRSSVSGSPDSAEIPPDVKKQGAASIAAWLQSNPEAAKAYSNNR